MLQEVVKAYSADDFAKGDELMASIELAVTKLDNLLGFHQESLHTWLSDASAYGETEQESAYYVNNARLQITQWGGPKLKDYASKAWQGMYEDYYLPRWKMYLSAYRIAKETPTPFDDAAMQEVLIKWERDWITRTEIPTQSIPETPIEDAQVLMKAITR